MDTEKAALRKNDPRRFYRVIYLDNGLCDVWLSQGEAVPMYDDLNGRMDFNIRLLAVRGVNPEDPAYGGDLEEHIRRNYYSWVESAEVIEI